MAYFSATDIKYVELEETSSITEYILDKLNKLENFYPRNSDKKISIHGDEDKKTVRDNITVKINIKNENDFIEVKESGYDLYGVIDKAADVLKERLKKMKDKLKDHHME